jgi:hypothetical protein
MVSFMRPPRFLLGCALLFWGWQTNLLVVGALLAVVLESGRLLETRWELSDEDFGRIWTFCTLLFLASAAYAFTSNEGPSSFQGLFQAPTLRNQRTAGLTTAKTAASLIRWMPMVFFLFVGAQVFSSREGIPLETISLILRRRWKKARRLGQALPASMTADISYPYFAMCLFAASSHAGESTTFFWGLCVLLAWALWSRRSSRFGLPTWAAVLATAIILGYIGQGGLGRLRSYLETFNPQWLSSFTRRGSDPNESKTQLGQIGRIKTSTKIVIRVEPKEHSPAPTLLREASYRTYSKGQNWNAGESRNDFENLLPETNNTFVLVPQKTNTAVVSLACYLYRGQGLLPLPRGSGRLENLPAYVLHKNSAGAVLAEGPGLVVFDARFGPGATIDSNPSTNEDSGDFAIPIDEIPALDQVISELGLTRQVSQQEALHSINGFFQARFNYSLWQERERGHPGKTNGTPVNRFLLRTRSGHCEYFATATVLLLRRLGIPARYAVGYAVHETSGRGYVVRQRDAHAWCLVWNRKTQLWEDFDTTPASWVEAESKRASPLLWLSDAWSRITFEFSKLRYGQTHLRQYLLWATVPILILLLFQIFFRRHRRRLRHAEKATGRADQWPGLDSEFYQLEKSLAQRGLIRASSEPLSAWLCRAAADPILAQARVSLRELLGLHYRYRFDPYGINASDRATLQREAKACLAKLHEFGER